MKPIDLLVQSALWFAFFVAVWPALARARPCNVDQPAWRKGLHADLFYWFAGPIAYGAVQIGLIALAADSIFGGPDGLSAHLSHGLFGVRDWPLWVQIPLALLLMDVAQYWTHRLFHEGRLWDYHAIHHGPEHVDWLTSARFHPVNVLVHSTFVMAAIVLIGFDPVVFAVLLPFNMVYSTMVHANVNWDFGPLKGVFASPVFHRWHHSNDPDVRNKNFAPTFAFLDVMFGTFHMPEGRLPEGYGVPEAPVPETVRGQLSYPFRRRAARAENAAPAT